MTNSNERLSKMETEVEHIKEDVSEMRSKMDGIGTSIVRIDLALSKLTTIAEQNQLIEPRVKHLELKIARWGGVILTISTGLSLLGPEVKVLLGKLLV